MFAVDCTFTNDHDKTRTHLDQVTFIQFVFGIRNLPSSQPTVATYEICTLLNVYSFLYPLSSFQSLNVRGKFAVQY